MEFNLQETQHPDKFAKEQYDSLIGIDEKKDELLNTLTFLFDKGKIDEWHKKHHKKQLSFFNQIVGGLPLIILSGDVGCGKTALANSIATPLVEKIDKLITCYETPSNIRGGGRVGGISDRITEAFTRVKAALGKDKYGILIIDEADDLATEREQEQAHHEDRAGVNVLIKQIDLIAREKINLVVLLITNRLKVLDPAVVRRSTKILHFERPNQIARELLFKSIFAGVEISENAIKDIVTATESEEALYSYSDLVQKVGKAAIFKAINMDKPFSTEIYLEVLGTVKPSPLLK